MNSADVVGAAVEQPHEIDTGREAEPVPVRTRAVSRSAEFGQLGPQGEEELEVEGAHPAVVELHEGDAVGDLLPLDHQPAHPLVIGSRRSLPNALGDTRTPGGAWRRLYSLRSTSRATRRTVVGVEPLGFELGYRPVTFNVSLEDRVEHVVGRERVGVELAGGELGRRRLVEDVLGDDAPRPGCASGPGGRRASSRRP